VVFGHTHTVAGGQRGKVGLAIGHQVLWAGECRVEQAFITHALPAAVLGQTFGVQQQQRLFADPAPAHLAN